MQTGVTQIATSPTPVTITLTHGQVVSGDVHVRPDGYQQRVSDLLNRGNDEFVPLTEATMTVPDGTPQRYGCVVVARGQIVSVACHDTRSTRPDVAVDQVGVDESDEVQRPPVAVGW